MLLVFDVTNDRTYDNLTKWLNQINEIKPCPFFIAGNKADLEEERIVDDDAVRTMEQNFNSRCFLTSSVTGQQVDEAFHALLN